MAAGSVRSADHLPDAAARLGTIVINEEAQFTIDRTVTLDITATAGNVTRMQFSEDATSWSPPEPYRTARSWTLGEIAEYPPYMNTVLKTVYVRFQDDTGAWSKAVTDSIILARSSADVPQLAEVWITQSAPIDFDASQPAGSRQNPYIVPTSGNERQFDAIMNSLMLAFASYRAQADPGLPAPMPANAAIAPTIRLGPGIFETHGVNRAYGNGLAWGPSDGWRIIGAGKNLTTLKAVQISRGFASQTIVIGSYTGGAGGFNNFEVSDLTIDANLHEGGANYQNRYTMGMYFVGNNVQLRRLRVKNFGTTIGGAENLAINMQNFGSSLPVCNLILEDCEIVQPQVGNAYKSGLVGIGGKYLPNGQVCWWKNVVVRNCYFNGAAYDGDAVVDPLRYAFNDRGTYGVSVTGCIGSVVEDNLVVDACSGFYMDSSSSHDITVRNNHFRNVTAGTTMICGVTKSATNRIQDRLVFAGNFVELDPRLYPAGDNYGTYGWRFGFSLTGIRTMGGVIYPDVVLFNRVVFTNNVFQFTDLSAPSTNIGGIVGDVQATGTAVFRDNIFRGLTRPIRWDNSPAFLDQQVDMVDPNRPSPVICQNNRREDGTVVEPYPYVLDHDLGRLTVRVGDAITFPAPAIEGLSADTVSGAPDHAGIDTQGIFLWQTRLQDVGRYVVGFHSGTNRLTDPRRMLITILPATTQDENYFANGLAAWWKMDETAGTLLRDSSGNGLDINGYWALKGGSIALGGAGPQPGSAALQFTPPSGAWGQALTVVNSSNILFDTLSPVFEPLQGKVARKRHPFTVSCWFKPAIQPRNGQLLFGLSGSFYLGLWRGTNNLQSLSAYGGDFTVTGPTNIALGVWRHTALVYDGTAMQIYLDGQKVGEMSFGQIFELHPWLLIGGGDGWETYGGSLGHLCIWKRPLTGAEITQVRDAQASGLAVTATPTAPSGLVAQSDTGGSVLLGWIDNASNESGFIVERSSDGVNFSPIANPGPNSVACIDPAPPAAACLYRVKAWNVFGASLYSSPAASGQCLYRLSSTGTNLGPVATTATFTLTTSPNCPWTALVSPGCDWLHTSSAGMGPGIVAFTLDANTGTNSRSASITILGQGFQVTQLPPISPHAGTYTALIRQPGEVTAANSGLLTLTTSAQGSLSGRVQIGAKSYSTSGKFDTAGRARVTINRTGLAPLTLEIQLQREDPDFLQGSLTDGATSQVLSGGRGVFDARANPSPFTGKYTLVIPGQDDSASGPTGDGYATMSVDAAGKLKISGVLADGTVFTQGTFVNKSGSWPLYLPLYGKTGVALGAMSFTSGQSSETAGGVAWTKPSGTKSRYHTNAFSTESVVISARYVAPAPGASILTLSEAQLLLTGSDLSTDLRQPVRLGPNSAVTDANGAKLGITFVTSSGRVRGRVTDASTLKAISFTGVVLQDQNLAAGFFLGTKTSGRAYLGSGD